MKNGKSFLTGWDWMSSSRNFLVEFHWIDPPKNSQNFVEKAHYPDATPLNFFYKNSFNPSLTDVRMFICLKGHISSYLNDSTLNKYMYYVYTVCQT